MKNKTLKPCPFCGEEVELIAITSYKKNVKYRIRHQNEDCFLGTSEDFSKISNNLYSDYSNEDELIQYWNTRNGKYKILTKFQEQIEKSEPMSKEIGKVVNDEFWDMLQVASTDNNREVFNEIDMKLKEVEEKLDLHAWVEKNKKSKYPEEFYIGQILAGMEHRIGPNMQADISNVIRYSTRLAKEMVSFLEKNK